MKKVFIQVRLASMAKVIKLFAIPQNGLKLKYIVRVNDIVKSLYLMMKAREQ